MLKIFWHYLWYYRKLICGFREGDLMDIEIYLCSLAVSTTQICNLSPVKDQSLLSRFSTPHSQCFHICDEKYGCQGIKNCTFAASPILFWEAPSAALWIEAAYFSSTADFTTNGFFRKGYKLFLPERMMVELFIWRWWLNTWTWCLLDG